MSSSRSTHLEMDSTKKTSRFHRFFNYSMRRDSGDHAIMHSSLSMNEDVEGSVFKQRDFSLSLTNIDSISAENGSFNAHSIKSKGYMSSLYDRLHFRSSVKDQESLDPLNIVPLPNGCNVATIYGTGIIGNFHSYTSYFLKRSQNSTRTLAALLVNAMFPPLVFLPITNTLSERLGTL